MILFWEIEILSVRIKRNEQALWRILEILNKKSGTYNYEWDLNG
jgi:hypothetical protein